MKILNGILSILLISFAAVQYNDPDAFLWIIIYLATALMTGATLFDQYHITITQLLMFILSVNLLILLPEFSSTFANYDSNTIIDASVTHTANVQTEIFKEVGGLIICLLVLTFVFWQSKKTASNRLQRL